MPEPGRVGERGPAPGPRRPGQDLEQEVDGADVLLRTWSLLRQRQQNSPIRSATTKSVPQSVQCAPPKR